MKKSIILTYVHVILKTIFLVPIYAFAIEGANPFYSPMHALGSVEFDYRVQFSTTDSPENEVRDHVSEQMKYMLYTMNNSTPYGNFELSNVQIRPSLYKGQKIWDARYHIKMKVAASSSGPFSWKVYLPFYPDSLSSRIVRDGQNICGEDAVNLFYKWRPLDCPLEPGVDFQELNISLTLLPSNLYTSPEYNRLEDNGVVRIAALFNNFDFDFDFLQQLVTYLPNFEHKEWSKAEIATIAPGVDLSGVRVIMFTWQHKGRKIELLAFQGDAMLTHVEKSRAFHYYLKHALENFSVITYAGHAGLGHNLNLRKIELSEKFKINPKKEYQIVGIEACFAAYYYTNFFWEKKITAADPRGTKDMDIITHEAQPAMPGISIPLALTRVIQDWITGIYPWGYTEVIGKFLPPNYIVSGDEDN
ncbi:MAG: hypothetical protein AABY64_04690 [Bdellovibrionota bacterium]